MARVLICPKCRTLITDDTRLPEGHRAFFAFLTRAYECWPETSTFTPDSPEHLRAWALVQTGHIGPPLSWSISGREHKIIMPFVTAMMAHELRSGRYCWARENEGKIEIVHPVSLNWNSMGQRKFAAVTEAVYALIKETAGLDFEEWLKMEHQRQRDVA